MYFALVKDTIGVTTLYAINEKENCGECSRCKTGRGEIHEHAERTLAKIDFSIKITGLFGRKDYAEYWLACENLKK